MKKYFNRIAALLIPFFVWGGVNDLYFRLSPMEILRLYSYGYPYWFLWVMFLFVTLLFAAQLITIKTQSKSAIITVMIVLWALSCFIATDRLGLQWIALQMPYFILGFTWSYLSTRNKRQRSDYKNITPPHPTIQGLYSSILKKCDLFTTILKTVAILGALIFFVWFSPQWTPVTHFSWGTQCNEYLPMGKNMLIALSGIILIFTLFSVKRFNTLGNQIGKYFGQITLEIYVVHYFFIFIVNSIGNRLNISLEARISIAFLTAIIGSYIFVTLIKRLPSLDRAMFGRK